MTAPDTSKVEQGTLRIRNQDTPVRTVWIDQSKLQFYVDNPRIYSVVRTGGKVPDQTEIYEELLEQEHVRELKHDIKLHGGLLDALIVKTALLKFWKVTAALRRGGWLYNNDKDTHRCGARSNARCSRPTLPNR